MSNYVNISSTLWSFRTLRILMEVNYLSVEYTCLSVRWLIGSSIEKNQACIYVESRVWIWSCINIHRFFLESSDYRDSDASFKVSIFSSEPSTTSVNPSIDRLTVEIKPVFTKKRQFECRLESKFIALFRILRTVRILTQGPNPKVSLGSCLPLVGSFCLRNWRRNWSLKKLENIEFDYWEGSVMLAHFGIFFRLSNLNQVSD